MASTVAGYIVFVWLYLKFPTVSIHVHDDVIHFSITSLRNCDISSDAFKLYSPQHLGKSLSIADVNRSITKRSEYTFCLS